MRVGVQVEQHRPKDTDRLRDITSTECDDRVCGNPGAPEDADSIIKTDSAQEHWSYMDIQHKIISIFSLRFIDLQVHRSCTGEELHFLLLSIPRSNFLAEKVDVNF